MYNMQKTEYDWQYYLEKSDKASLATPGGCFWPRGKMLGGSSSINAMMYVRGNRRDYDTWYEWGNPGWAYRDVLKYFKKSEDNKLAYEGGDQWTGFHGKGGPLKIDMFFGFDPIKDMLMEAVKELGFNLIENVNAEEVKDLFLKQSILDKLNLIPQPANGILFYASNR